MKRFLASLCFGLFFISLLWGQPRVVTGKVIDVQGQALPGATILIKGSPLGTTSELDGNFSIWMPEGFHTLIFQYIGYTTLTVEVGDREKIDVILQESFSTLDEVIIVGYGQEIKSRLTGNIAKIGKKEIQYLPVNSIEEALQGKTAGLLIEKGSGRLGSEIDIQVRGPNSINARNYPIVVVDGIPITVDGYKPGSNGSWVNMLTYINFNDVESVEILKDAAASAIYGSRAANGVMLITTKRGKEGQASIDFNYQTGFSNPTHLREFLNAEQYIDLLHRSAIGAGEYAYETDPASWNSQEQAIQYYTNVVENQLDVMSGHTDWRKLETDTDWQALAFQDAPLHQADLAISGGGNQMRYYTSLGFSDQRGILLGDRYRKYNGRLNLDGLVRKNLEFGMNFSFSHVVHNDLPPDSNFETPLSTANLSPITPVRDQEGEYYNQPVTLYYNPLIELENTDRKVTNNNLLGNYFLAWKLLPGLSLRSDFGLNLIDIKNNYFNGGRSFLGKNSNGVAFLQERNSLNYDAKALLDYTPVLSNDHHVHFVGGCELQRTDFDITYIKGSEFPWADLRTLYSAAFINDAWEYTTAYSFLSYFGRLNYDFEGKYLFDLSARYDGSSRFGKGNKYGFFPSVSAGWVLSEEPFLKELDVLSFLKVRTSYGITGNASIGNHAHLGLFGVVQYGGLPGLVPTQSPNPDLSWEKTSQWDLGLDFGLFEHRVNGQMDYYVKRTTDLIVFLPVPNTSGFSVQVQNLAEVSNKGVELMLNTHNLTGRLKWETHFNFAYNKNKVVKIADDQDIVDYGSATVFKAGYPLKSFLLVEYAGVDPENGDALFYVNSPDAPQGATTTNFNEAERVILGDPNPDFIGGLTNTFTWNGLSLNIHVQGVLGKETFRAFDQWISCNGCGFDNQTLDQLEAWENPGDVTDVPEPRLWLSNESREGSSRYLEDASYVRVKTIGLSYNFSNKVLAKLRVRHFILYLQAQNWFSFTRYNGWDPESSTGLSGIDSAAAPQAKTLTIGARIGW